MHVASSVVAPVNKMESVAEALSKRFPIAQVWLVMFRHWRDVGDSVTYSYCPAGQLFKLGVHVEAPSSLVVPSAQVAHAFAVFAPLPP